MSQKQDKPRLTRFVGPKEICDDFGITQQTLAAWIKAGTFPQPMRLGLRKRVWIRLDLEEFYKAAAGAAKGSAAEV